MRTRNIVIAGIAALAVSSVAHATVRFQPGTTCEGLYQNWSKMYREERGILNLDTTQPQGVVCPAKAPDLPNNNNTCSGGNFSTTVFYDDGSNVDSFFCQMFKVSGTGTMTWGVGRYTCSQSGGCPDPTTPFMGTGSLSLPALSASVCGGTAQNLGAICNMPRHASPGASFIILTSTTGPI
jgi:hypothetical protein